MPRYRHKILQEKGRFVIPLIMLLFFSIWIVNLYVNREWFVLGQQISWLIRNASFDFNPISIKGVPIAILVTLEVLLLGTLLSNRLLKNEEKLIKQLCALGLGLGVTGFVVVLLGILGWEHRIILNAVLCILICLSLGYKTNRLELWYIFLDSISIWRPGKLSAKTLWFTIPFILIFGFTLYHALLTPVLHWDATVYHATMAKILYRNSGFPLIAGHSMGLEMSSAYPPFFPALGAYFYIQINQIEDFYIRAIPPVMGLMTALTVYQVGKELKNEVLGKIGALLVYMTPIFLLYSTYATSYSTLAFFITASMLFVLLAIKRGGKKYWALAGIFYGLALLTSYQAILYFFVGFMILLLYLLIRRELGLSDLLVFSITALAVGVPWYLRNLLLLGNPVYPFIFGGNDIDPGFLAVVSKGIYDCSVGIMFGESGVSTVQWIFTTLTYRPFFPAFSIASCVGLVTVMHQKVKKTWFIPIFIYLPAALIISSGVVNIFPRYFMLLLPGFALFTALPLTKLPKVALVILITITLLFPTSGFFLNGKLYSEATWQAPTEDALFLLTHPNPQPSLALTTIYGHDPELWSWLRTHLEEDDKIATYENKVYYLADGNEDSIFYLDGWEARELYSMDREEEICRWLQERHVTYILDPEWIRGWSTYRALPLNAKLGSPYLPVVLVKGGSAIYHVGPLDDPIVSKGSLPVSLSGDGWSSAHELEGVKVRAIFTGDDRVRLRVASVGLVNLRVTYLDRGISQLYINLQIPQTDEWINGYSVIRKQDTNKWKISEILLPVDNRRGFVELGLYVQGLEDMVISNIEAVPYQVPGRSPLQAIDGIITDMTEPPTLMIYLPILDKGERIFIATESYGQNVSIEVFQGIIQPWETSGWGEEHRMVAEYPITHGSGGENLVAVWQVEKAGIYTLVVLSCAEYLASSRIDMTIMRGEK
jgi:4-amino-4-deoxy-L-arabinose transferase-like glycosyltransferase